MLLTEGIEEQRYRRQQDNKVSARKALSAIDKLQFYVPAERLLPQATPNPSTTRPLRHPYPYPYF